jgi:penicillin-binding protein 1A
VKVDMAERYERGRGAHAKRIIKRLFLLFLVLGVAGFAWLWFAPCGLGGCAPVTQLNEFQAEGSQLLDINGEQFGTLATVNRRVVSLDSLPPHLPQAFLAVEDTRFYEHSGVDWQRMGGALRATASSLVGSGGRVEGGSTITMQLARNLFPEHLPYTERSLRRKAMEIRVARQIERAFPKEKILELYLNHIYLGDGAYGVEAASQAYFGKPAAELTLAEAAMLGGLPKAPSQINPKQNRERALERRNLVLREMAEAGYIQPAEAEEAIEQPVRLARKKGDAGDLKGSYFIERVRRELEQHVGDRFYTAGLKIHTTLDATAQKAAEEELSKQLSAIEGGQFGTYRHETYANAKGVAAETGETPYLQGMVVVMDAATGEVRALVGGRDYDDSKFDRAVQALRQPGSAFKPFVYLSAIERYRSPIHKVEDAPIQLAMSGGRVWEPKNYTGQYDGPMTLREALTRSKNTATVRLAQEVGMSSVIRSAQELGITSDVPEVPSAALGAAEVRPIELVAAYAPFANGGTRVEPHFVRRIEDRDGRVLWEANPVREQVLDPAVAFVMTSMLRDVVDRGTGTAVRAAGFSGAAAGKTGTTNAATDVWFVGYTPELVGGVWIGMDNPQTIVRGASGGTLAAPVWGRIMNRVYARRPAPPAWQPPRGVVTEEVDRATGQVVGEWCPARGATYTEYFVNVPPPRQICRPEDSYSTVYADAGQPWQDEEWNTGVDVGGMDDTMTVDTRNGGIHWPQLDSLRNARGGTDPATRPRQRETQDRLGERPADPRRPQSDVDTTRRGGAEPRPPRDTVQPEPPAPRDTVRPEPPELLGEPIRRDTTGTSLDVPGTRPEAQVLGARR